MRNPSGSIQYVCLDPTGNLTCLVLDGTDPESEKIITARLMGECEQVAYLEVPAASGSRARIRLMGGEFCGNAAMAAACYLASRDGLKDAAFPLEVSGAEKPVSCRARLSGDQWEGTVEMPRILGVTDIRFGGYDLTAVMMEGIRHLVLTESIAEDREAEELLRKAAETVPEEAVGLLQWNRETGAMRPLVLVKGSGTLVWETGCGSGSAAIGAWEALRRGNGQTETAVHQPGGVIRSRAAAENGRILSVSITGKVSLGTEKSLEI